MVSIAVIFAVETAAATLPQYLTYDTSVSGWFDMYMHRKPDFSATGSAMLRVSWPDFCPCCKMLWGVQCAMQMVELSSERL